MSQFNVQIAIKNDQNLSKDKGKWYKKTEISFKYPKKKALLIFFLKLKCCNHFLFTAIGISNDFFSNC